MTSDVIRTLSAVSAATYEFQQLHRASVAIQPMQFIRAPEAEDVETTIELEFDREDWLGENDGKCSRD